MSADDIQLEINLTQSLIDKQAQLNQKFKEAKDAQLARVGSLSDEVNFLKSIGRYQDANEVHAKNLVKQAQKQKEQMKEYVKDINKVHGGLGLNLKLMRKALEIESERLAVVSRYDLKIDEINDKHKKGVEYLQAQGNYIRSNLKDYAKGKFGLTQEEGLGHVNQKAGAAVKGASILSKDGGASGVGNDLIGKLGIWGMIIGMFIDGIDKVNKNASALHQAAGATGEFNKGLRHFAGVAAGAELQFSSLSDALVGQMGMTSTEVLKDAGELASAGIKISDSLSGNGGMTSQFKKLESLAYSTGQGLGTVGKQFATMINTFRMGKSQALEAYKGIKETANSLQETFETTSAEWIDSIMSVAAASATLGTSITQIGDLFNTLGTTLKGTKVPMEQVTATASALSNIGKADKGWLAFMGKMGGGASGGFLGGLGAAQQRGANFMGPAINNRTLDTGAQIEMLMKTLDRATRGTSGRAKQFLTEDFGSKFGLSDEQTQIVQKMKSGKLSRAAGGAAWDKMEADTKFNKMGAKGMMDHLENLIKKLIMAPIMAIYKVLTMKWFGGNDEAGLGVGSGGDGGGFTKNPYGGKRAMGGPISPGMSYLVGENGPEVFSSRSGGSISPNSSMGGGTPVSININVGMNERDLKTAFDKAHGQTLQLVRKTKQKMMM